MGRSPELRVHGVVQSAADAFARQFDGRDVTGSTNLEDPKWPQSRDGVENLGRGHGGRHDKMID